MATRPLVISENVELCLTFRRIPKYLTAQPCTIEFTIANRTGSNLSVFCCLDLNLGILHCLQHLPFWVSSIFGHYFSLKGTYLSC